MNRPRQSLGACWGIVLFARAATAQPAAFDEADPAAPEPLPDMAAPAEPPTPPVGAEPTAPVGPEPEPTAPVGLEPTAPVGLELTAPSATFPAPTASADTWSQTRLPDVQTRTEPSVRPLSRAEAAVSAPIWQPMSAAPNADSGVQYEEPRKRDDSWGLFGPVRIGALIGIGLPSLVNFGGALKVTRYFGAGINIGLIPTVKMATYGEAKVSYQEYDVYGRIYPFGGGFFLGAGVGYAHAKGSYSKSMNISTYADQYPALGIPDAISSESRGAVEAMVVTPQLGYFQIFRSGFCVGADVGAQIPVASDKIELETEVSVPGASPQVRQQVVDRYVTPAQKEVYDTLEAVARTPIPTFNLRIGWML